MVSSQNRYIEPVVWCGVVWLTVLELDCGTKEIIAGETHTLLLLVSPSTNINILSKLDKNPSDSGVTLFLNLTIPLKSSFSCGAKSSMMLLRVLTRLWNHVPRYKYNGSLNVNIAYHEELRQFSSAVRAYHDIGKMKILDFLPRLMFSIDMFSKTKLYIK